MFYSIVWFNIVFTICYITSVVNGLPAISTDDTCDCVCGVRGRTNRIVGGNVAPAHEYPWLVGLSKQSKIYCGATLISRKFVLTAAHCVNGIEASEIRVYIGGHNITKDFTDIRRVRRIQEHEGFDIISFNNDIALIELDKPVSFGPNVQPACLPDGSRTDFAGSLTTIAGWGRTAEKYPTSPVLRFVTVPVWSQDQCLDSGYGPKRITENMMCAGYHDGKKDACQGDSGGPMQMKGPTGSMELIGIVSWGRGCARPNLPGIFTKVVNYLPWIQRKIGNSCMCSPRNDGQQSNELRSFRRFFF